MGQMHDDRGYVSENESDCETLCEKGNDENGDEAMPNVSSNENDCVSVDDAEQKYVCYHWEGTHSQSCTHIAVPAFLRLPMVGPPACCCLT